MGRFSIAVEQSVEHWKRMRENPWGWDKPIPEHCALCQESLNNGGCERCPVGHYTQFGSQDWCGCDDTWYQHAHECYRRLGAYGNGGTPRDVAAFRSACDKVLGNLSEIWPIALEMDKEEEACNVREAPGGVALPQGDGGPEGQGGDSTQGGHDR